MITMDKLEKLKSLKKSLSVVDDIDFYYQIEALCLQYNIDEVKVELYFMDGEIYGFDITLPLYTINDLFEGDVITAYAHSDYRKNIHYIKGENPYKEIEQELVKIANIYDSFN